MTAVTRIRRRQILRTQMLPSANRFGLLIVLAMTGCGIASAPLKDPPQIVATPEQGQLNVTTQPSRPIGDVLPVYVSIANGSDVPRSIVASQIFALNDSGAKIWLATIERARFLRSMIPARASRHCRPA